MIVDESHDRRQCHSKVHIQREGSQRRQYLLIPKFSRLPLFYWLLLAKSALLRFLPLIGYTALLVM